MRRDILDLASAGRVIESRPRKKRRRFSAQAIANIRAGATRRWGKVTATNGPVEPTRKRKRRMSAARKVRLSAIAKARWKKARAEAKTAL
jgi:hypothetical protein